MRRQQKQRKKVRDVTSKITKSEKRSKSSSNVKVFLLSFSFFFQLLNVDCFYHRFKRRRRLRVSEPKWRRKTHEKNIVIQQQQQIRFFFLHLFLSLSLLFAHWFRHFDGWLCCAFFFFPDHPQSLSSSNLNCLLFSSAALAPSRAHTPSSFLASFTLARALLGCFLCAFFASLLFFGASSYQTGKQPRRRFEGSPNWLFDYIVLSSRIQFQFPYSLGKFAQVSKFVSSRFVLVFVSEISSENCIYIFCRNYLSTCA